MRGVERKMAVSTREDGERLGHLPAMAVALDGDR